MASIIAETAAVDPRAEIAEGVEIGPYCVVGPDVKIGRNTRLIAHVCLLGWVEMGESNLVSPFTVIGGDPQDVSYHGARTKVEPKPVVVEDLHEPRAQLIRLGDRAPDLRLRMEEPALEPQGEAAVIGHPQRSEHLDVPSSHALSFPPGNIARSAYSLKCLCRT